jgi:hypothetical protein
MPASDRRPAALRALEAHLASPRVPRVIYGAIIGLALVVALEAHPPTAGVIVGSLLATAVAVALAEVYSDVVGTEARLRRRIDRPELREAWAQAAAVAVGIAFPAAFFALSALGAFERDTAFTIAEWSGLALIGLYAFAGARLAGQSVVGSLLRACAIALVGAALIAFKALLH